MQFIALIYVDPSIEPAPGTAEFDAYVSGYKAASAVYAKDNVFVAGEPLEHPSTATTLRINGGKVEMMDGPFAESKEQLGGFYIFECDGLDQALKYAALIPAAKHGAIEIRPIQKIDCA